MEALGSVLEGLRGALEGLRGVLEAKMSQDSAKMPQEQNSSRITERIEPPQDARESTAVVVGDNRASDTLYPKKEK